LAWAMLRSYIKKDFNVKKYLDIINIYFNI
jgi:hypothetical protein